MDKKISNMKLTNIFKTSFAKNKKNNNNYITMKYKFTDNRQLFLNRKFEILNKKNIESYIIIRLINQIKK